MKNPFSKEVWSAKNIAGMAVFTALSFVVYLIEIPIFAGTPASFLQLDLSNVFVMLAGFMYGPLPAFMITVIKELIHITVGTTGGVGELANIIITTAYAIIPATVYDYKKGLKTVIISLIIACVVQTGVSLLVNKFINFPFFMGSAPFVPTEISNSMFSTLWVYVLAFNAIKSVVVSVITVLLYKKVSFLFKKMSLQKSAPKVYNMSMEKFTTKSDAETMALATEYAKTLNKGDVVLLDGDMGAGKTVFTKGLAKGLGLKDQVTSPTYAYLNVYGNLLYHYDCYRLSCGEDAESLGLTDYFGEPNTICVIEWSSNIVDALPEKVKRVTINKISETEREIILQ
jgi:tRNA threonylcarbamoyladenosine biosynthesis protein TsaE